LFQGCFHSFLIDSEAYLAEVLRHVVLNPVRAGVVDDPARYRWSSYRTTAGLTDAAQWFDREKALELFGHDVATAARGYAEFVGAAIGSRERLWDKAVHGIFLGTREWARRMRKRVESRIRSTDHPKTQRAVGRPAMHETIDAVARAAA
jgi:putative transposase